MIEGKECRLRCIEQADLELLRQWRTSRAIRPYFTYSWMISPLEQQRWFEAMNTDKRQRFFVAEDIQGNRRGVVNVQAIHHQHGTATVGWYFMPDPQRPLRKFTRYAAVALLDYVFGELGLRKVYSDVLVTNTRALKFNERRGFEIEGCQKAQVYHQGAYVVCFG